MIEKKPVVIRPEFRPIGLGLWLLFSKKPEPDLQARARPTSKFCSIYQIAQFEVRKYLSRRVTFLVQVTAKPAKIL
jgi:hypothetical protein